MNKKPKKALQFYEEIVRVACDTCKETIENARREFLTAKQVARHIRDKKVSDARLHYGEGVKESDARD